MSPDFELLSCDPKIKSLDRWAWTGPWSQPRHVHKDREVPLSKEKEREKDTHPPEWSEPGTYPRVLRLE